MVATTTLDAAFAWLCKRRQNYPASADVWDFRRDWPQEKACMQSEILAGRYRFGLLSRVELADGEEIDLWSAPDALVLKAITIALQPVLPISHRCTHVKGHGGTKAAVRRVMARLAGNRFVLKTDVKSYYASIDHHRLLDRLAAHIRDKAVLTDNRAIGASMMKRKARSIRHSELQNHNILWRHHDQPSKSCGA